LEGELTFRNVKLRLEDAMRPPEVMCATQSGSMGTSVPLSARVEKAVKRGEQFAQTGGFDWFATGLTSSFFLVDLLNVLHHELWRDEVGAWLIARQSHSIFDLVRNMRYEGHPALWFLLLFGLTRFTHVIFTMQVLNLVIATGTAYLIAAHSPFSRLQKVLLCFGYFPLYEYGTISRNYGVGLLLLFWFCVAYHPDRRQSWVGSAVLLSLLANTSVYGAMIAISFAVSFMVIPAIATKDGGKSRFFRSAYSGKVALILLIGLMLAILQMHPPPDTFITWKLHSYNVQKTMTVVWKAFFPIPKSLSHFWNSNILDSKKRTMILGSMVILIITFDSLWRRRLALIAYASVAAAILLFSLLIDPGFERHFGHLFVAFIACFWISAKLKEEPVPRSLLEWLSPGLAAQRKTILTCLLGVHVMVAVIVSGVDWKRPFSQGKAAAAFLRNKGLAERFVVSRDYAGETIAGYLDRGVYYTGGQGIGTFIVWNQNWRRYPENPIESATEFANKRHEDVLIVSSSPLENAAGVAHSMAEFTGSIVQDEEFYIYRIEPVRR